MNGDQTVVSFEAKLKSFRNGHGTFALRIQPIAELLQFGRHFLLADVRAPTNPSRDIDKPDISVCGGEVTERSLVG